MTMHTPGPWTVEEYGDNDCPSLVIHRDSENRICFMATPGSHGDPAKIGADAYLIAAAPDMLAALKRAVSIADVNLKEKFSGRTDECAQAYHACIEAIAKAEGKP